MPRRSTLAVVAALIVSVVVVVAISTSGSPEPAPRPGPPAGAAIYVAPGGRDTSPGTQDAPVATLPRARDLVRKHRRTSPHQPVTVYLRSGRYRVASPFELTSADSGTAEAPVTYRNYPDEQATLVAGADLTHNGFTAVSDQSALSRLPASSRGRVLQYDLRTIPGLGAIPAPPVTGQSLPAAAPPPELFLGDAPATLARWPNTGFLTTTGATTATAGIGFVSRESVGRVWRGASDLMVLGYWRYDWAEAALHVRSHDARSGWVATSDPAPYGVGDGRRYYFYNLLEELDAPGEYFIDRAARRLYLMPPAGWGPDQRVTLSLSPGPVVRLNGSQHVVWDGIGVQAGRGNGVEITNASEVLVTGASIGDLGGVGVLVRGGRNVGVTRCTLSHTGDAALDMVGGDRDTLTAAGHYAENNTISNFGRIQRSYAPGISLGGVGNRAVHNDISQAPHAAVILFGNDHEVSHNFIHDVAQETADVGAIYLGRDWTGGGNRITDNYLRDIGTTSLPQQAGIYLDDFASGQSVRNNVVAGADIGVLVGGGRNNDISGNVLAATAVPLYADARGLDWAASMCGSRDGALNQALRRIPHTSQVWRSRFPWLADIARDPCTPRANRITGNRWWGGTNQIASQYAVTGQVSGNSALAPDRPSPAAPIGADDHALWAVIGSSAPISRRDVGVSPE